MSRAYSITLDQLELATPEVVQRIFAVVQQQSVVCLSDIKRETELKYDVIRAALRFLESKNLIRVMSEEAQRRGIDSQQIPVEVTKIGRRTSSEEVWEMLSQKTKQESETSFRDSCEVLVHSPQSA